VGKKIVVGRGTVLENESGVLKILSGMKFFFVQ
jgi:hypothetical protein